MHDDVSEEDDTPIRILAKTSRDLRVPSAALFHA